MSGNDHGHGSDHGHSNHEANDIIPVGGWQDRLLAMVALTALFWFFNLGAKFMEPEGIRPLPQTGRFHLEGEHEVGRAAIEHAERGGKTLSHDKPVESSSETAAQPETEKSPESAASESHVEANPETASPEANENEKPVQP